LPASKGDLLTQGHSHGGAEAIAPPSDTSIPSGAKPLQLYRIQVAQKQLVSLTHRARSLVALRCGVDARLPQQVHHGVRRAVGVVRWVLRRNRAFPRRVRRHGELELGVKLYATSGSIPTLPLRHVQDTKTVRIHQLCVFETRLLPTETEALLDRLVHDRSCPVRRAVVSSTSAILCVSQRNSFRFFTCFKVSEFSKKLHECNGRLSDKCFKQLKIKINTATQLILRQILLKFKRGRHFRLIQLVRSFANLLEHVLEQPLRRGAKTAIDFPLCGEGSSPSTRRT